MSCCAELEGTTAATGHFAVLEQLMGPAVHPGTSAGQAIKCH